MEQFQKVVITTKYEKKTKHGKEKKQLKQISTDATLRFNTYFLAALPPKLIQHRNKLQHFSSITSQFRNSQKWVYLDFDFSEDLTPEIKH